MPRSRRTRDFDFPILEQQRYPDLREYPGGPPNPPYDVTAQTLPLLMGVTSVEVADPFKTDLEKVDQIELPAGKIKPRGKEYLLKPDSNNAYLAVNRLRKSGAQIGRLTKIVQDNGREFPAGTFVIRSGDVRGLAPLGVDFFASNLPLSDAVPLRSPRIGIYKSYDAAIDEGWTRWLLEQYEFLYTRRLHKLRTGRLGSMHYERAPRFRRSRLDVAPPPLRCAVQGFAPLRRR